MELTLEQRREQRVLFEKAYHVGVWGRSINATLVWNDSIDNYDNVYVATCWDAWRNAVEANAAQALNAKYDLAWITEQFNAARSLAKPEWYNEAGIVTDDGFIKLLRIFANRVLMAFGDTAGMHKAFSEAHELERPMREEMQKIAAILDATGLPDGTVLERVTALVAAQQAPEVLDWPNAVGPDFWWIKRSWFPAELCHVFTHHMSLVVETGKYTRDEVAANGWQFIRATPPAFPRSASC